MMRLSRWLAVAAPLLLAALFGSSCYAQPTLSAAVPGAVAPGKTTEVTLQRREARRSRSKSGPTCPRKSSWSPAIQLRRTKPRSSARSRCLPALRWESAGSFWPITRALASRCWSWSTTCRALLDNSDNHDLATAQDVQLPIGIDGHCDGTIFDYYRFTAKAGQRIVGDVLATRLGWDFDSGGSRARCRGQRSPASRRRCRHRRRSAIRLHRAGRWAVHAWNYATTATSLAGAIALRLGDLPLVSTTSAAGGRGRCSIAGRVCWPADGRCCSANDPHAVGVQPPGQ